jgi:hypothetical protein
MERSEFDAFTADDARVKAVEETDDGRRKEWWRLAAAIDMPAGRTAGDLSEELREGLYETTGAASADITVEVLARSLGASDPTNAPRNPEGAGGQQAVNDGNPHGSD